MNYNILLFIFIFLVFASFKIVLTHTKATLTTILLDPMPGKRTIEDSFERTITLHFIHIIKQLIESKISNIRVISTRVAGENVDSLQNATFSNRLHADFYITFLLFQTTEILRPLYIYYNQYNPKTDKWKKAPHKLTLQPYDQAYIPNQTKILHYSTLLEQELKAYERQYGFQCRGTFGIPLAITKGISAPALALEMGIKDKSDFKSIVTPIAQALIKIITFLMQETTLNSYILSESIN